jgi:hypothetical protein
MFESYDTVVIDHPKRNPHPCPLFERVGLAILESPSENSRSAQTGDNVYIAIILKVSPRVS